MDEQRQRQEDEQRRAIAESDVPAGGAAAAAVTSGVTATVAAAAGSSVTAAIDEPNTEEAMLQRALALSTETPVKRNRVRASVLFYSLFICIVLSKFAFQFFYCQFCLLIIWL